MRREELTKILSKNGENKKDYIDFEFYKFKDNKNKKIHTDYIEEINFDKIYCNLEKYEIIGINYMNEQEYNDTILANNTIKACFNEIYDMQGEMLVIFLKEKGVEENG